MSLLKRGVEPCPILSAAWKKYGEDNFVYEVLCICAPEELDQKESYYIERYDSFNNGYNCTRGGGGVTGYHHTPEAKEKIGSAFRGKKLSDDVRRKISESQRGRIVSEATRDAIKRSWTDDRKTRFSEAFSGENNPNYGRHGIEAYTRCSVMCNTGESFYTMADAALWCGLASNSPISTSCKSGCYAGRHPVTGEKLIWHKVDDSCVVDTQEPSNIAVSHKPIKLSGTPVIASSGEIFMTIKEAAVWAHLKSSGNIVECCKGKKQYIGSHPVTGERLSWRYASYEEIKNNMT